MNSEIQTEQSGWSRIRIGLTLSEIEILITRLQKLDSGLIDHFHFRQTSFEGAAGIADVEFVIVDNETTPNMFIP
jgi:hypothetical protein